MSGRSRKRRSKLWDIKGLFLFFVLLAIVLGSYYTFYNKHTPVTQQNFVQKTQQKIQQKLIPITPAPDKVLLTGAKWVPQSFNNCGPATTSMVLQYFGHIVDQETTKNALRTNPTDTNVFTYEIRDYLKSEYNIDSALLYNGDLKRLKLLLANGFYLVIEDYLHPDDQIGHFTILRGYDDEKGVFISDDSYLGTNIEYAYDTFDEKQWKPFNREYLPVFTPDKRPLFEAIVGEDLNKQIMYEKAIKRNEADIAKNNSDMYAYFNVGSSSYALGSYKEAEEAFKKSRELGWPKLMLWYQIQPIQTQNELHNYQEALALSDMALSDNDGFAEAHMEKAKAYKGLGQIEQARAEAEKALSAYPDMKSATDFLNTL